jgi:ABC-2 type transport system permease protein
VTRPSSAETVAGAAAGLPSVLSVGWQRARFDVRNFFRQKDAVGFTLAFPVMILVLFGAIFKGKVEGTNIEYSQVLVAGILASGVASVSFVSLSIGICIERSNGTLKRLAGTPMPWMSYFLGKIGLVLTTAAIEVVLIVGLGRLLFHLRLPTDVGHWWTLGWVFVLGITACTLLGIAMSSVPRNEKSAAAVVNLPFVALQFISGVFVPYNNLPGGLRAVASVFPLKWLSQGFRSAFLQRQFLVAEPGHSWQHPTMVVMLAAWCVAGAVLCAISFRSGTER